MSKPLFSRLLLLAGLALAIVHPMPAAETVPRVAILGDSISHTKHLCPGVPAGLPLDEAKTQAAKLLSDYQKENP